MNNPIKITFLYDNGKKYTAKCCDYVEEAELFTYKTRSNKHVSAWTNVKLKDVAGVVINDRLAHTTVAIQYKPCAKININIDKHQRVA